MSDISWATIGLSAAVGVGAAYLGARWNAADSRRLDRLDRIVLRRERATLELAQLIYRDLAELRMDFAIARNVLAAHMGSLQGETPTGPELRQVENEANDFSQRHARLVAYFRAPLRPMVMRVGDAELSSRFAALMDVVFDADVVKADLGSAMRGEQSSMWTAEDQFVSLFERAEELLTELAAEDAPPARSTKRATTGDRT